MKKNIDWEERRFIAATSILAGMAANYSSAGPMSSYRAEDAIRLADELIKKLSDESRPSICAHLYQRKK